MPERRAEAAWYGGDFELLWEDPDRRIHRARPTRPNAMPTSILVVDPASHAARKRCGERLRHEDRLKGELHEDWAVVPLAFVEQDCALLLRDPGGDILARLAGPSLPMERFLAIAIALAASVAKMHKAGWLHRDIKTSNIVVDAASGVARLTGFGIASRLERGPSEQTDRPGTLAYMAPEQTGRTNRPVDERSDLYSVGVTLYELLTGTLPLAASSPAEWIHCHLARQPPPPSDRRTAVPSQVSAIVMKLLSKSADDRYQTAASLVSDLAKCLADWKADKCIRAFPLGVSDAARRIRFRDVLYGRATEMAQLEAAYADVAATGQARVVLVSGQSGIGKSALIGALRKTLAASHAIFAIGKFDQYRRDEPYTAVAQAFQPLVRDLLGKADSEVETWRRSLQSALGPHGKLVVDLIPDLKHLIGPQPPVSDLSGAEARRRFLRAFRRFVDVFARPAHPLVLFLDDLQWLDAATLDLFRSLATHPGVGSLLLIGSYRSNEVGGRPELASLLDGLRALPRKPLQIPLQGIGTAHVAQMIADAVNSTPAAVAGLTACVMDKAGDNPFFAVQFVAALQDDGLLVHDSAAAAWGWDLERIRRRKVADNIVELMIERLRRLSDVSLHAVIVLACMGSRTPARKLAIALSRNEGLVRRCLEEAVTLGLVLRYSGEYAFAHDRIHEAAYAMLPDTAKGDMHWRIGMLLLANTADTDLDEHVFEIVSHLNRTGCARIPPADRPLIASLNLRAGRKARGSTAYAAACDYLATGQAQLHGADGAIHHALAYELALEHAECRFLAGGVTEAKAMVEALFTRARTELEIALANRLKIELHVVDSDNELAVDTAVMALNRLGMALVAHPSARDVRVALESAWRNFENRPAQPIAALPAMTDPYKLISMRLLADTWPAACFTDFNLAIVVVCNMVELSLAHGSAASSNQGFALFGLLMGPALGRYRDGYRLALEACEHAAPTTASRETSRTFNTMALTCAWTQPLEKSVEWARLAYQKGIEAGDIYFACFSAFHAGMHQFMQGRDLAEDAQACDGYLAFARDTGFKDGVALLTTLERSIACLRGATRGLHDFSDERFEGAAFEAEFIGRRLHIASQLYWTMMTMLRFLAGQYDAALEAAKRFDDGPRHQIHLVRHLDYHFYTGLSAASAWNTATQDRRPGLRAQLDAHFITIRKWAAETQSRTFIGKQLLLAAEIARLDERPLEAEQLYERSAQASRKHGCRQDEALASELAARFYHERGFERIAQVYLHDAVEAYCQWGADAKVNQLKRAHPCLRGFASDTGQPDAALVALHQFDYVGILAGSTTAPGDFALDKLLLTVMRAVMESTEAQYGALLRLHHPNGVEIIACARLAGDTVAVTLGDGPASVRLPEAILRHLMRTGDTLIVEDAASDERFRHDPQVLRDRLRAVLCVPVNGCGQQQTVLYLAHYGAPQAFAATRMDILELLVTHAAAALENARLYGELEKREARLRQLVESDVIGIQFWDLDGNVTYANDAFLRITGYDRADLDSGSISWRGMTPPEWRAEMPEKLRQIRATGALPPWEKEYVRKDGSRVPVLVGAAMFAASQSGVAFVLDLSDRKAAEQRALESERRNRELHVELAHANRIATMGQLSAWIAHDVKQPLGEIVDSGTAAYQALSRDPPGLREARDALDRIVRGGMHAAQILDRTRELVKKVSPGSDVVDINEVVAVTMALVAPEAMRLGIDIQAELDHTPMRATADRVQLQQVILNLLVNAIEAMSGKSAQAYRADDVDQANQADQTDQEDQEDQAGRSGQSRHPRALRVMTDSRYAQGYLLEIRDTGPGFSFPGEHDCFEAFVTTKRGALGMGLSICRSIVTLYGGRIWAAPNQPRGAILRVVLPRPGEASRADAACATGTAISTMVQK